MTEINFTTISGNAGQYLPERTAVCAMYCGIDPMLIDEFLCKSDNADSRGDREGDDCPRGDRQEVEQGQGWKCCGELDDGTNQK